MQSVAILKIIPILALNIQVAAVVTLLHRRMKSKLGIDITDVFKIPVKEQTGRTGFIHSISETARQDIKCYFFDHIMQPIAF